MPSSLTAEDRPSLAVRGIRVVKSRREVVAIDDLTFGSGVTAVLGPNGAGKTSLLEVLSLERPPSSGSILLDGVEIQGNSGRRVALRDMGHMPQELRFYSGFDTHSIVEYAGWLKGLSGQLLRSAVSSALQVVGLELKAPSKISKLSGGMQRRLGVAETIVHSPRLLLFDEPTVGLDPQQRRTFQTLVRDLANRASVIFTTHLVDDVAAMADHVVVIDQGRIGFTGPIAAFTSISPDGSLDEAYDIVVGSSGDSSR